MKVTIVFPQASSISPLRIPVLQPLSVSELVEAVNTRLAKAGQSYLVSHLKCTDGALLDGDDAVCDVISDGEAMQAVFAAAAESAMSEPATVSVVWEEDQSVVTASQPQAEPVDGELVFNVHAFVCGVPIDETVRIHQHETFESLCSAVLAVFKQEADVTTCCLFTEEFPLSFNATNAKEPLSAWNFKIKNELYCVFRPCSYNASPAAVSWHELFFANVRWQPSEHQSQDSLAAFCSTLCVVSAQLSEDTDVWARVLGAFRRLTCFPPAVLALNYLRHRIVLTNELCFALSEAFFFLCKIKTSATLDASSLFRFSRQIWARVFDSATTNDALTEQYSDDYVSDCQQKGHSGQLPVMLKWLNGRGVTMLPRQCVPSQSSSLEASWHTSDAEIGLFRFLRVVPALGLKAAVAPVLTWSQDGSLAVFTGRTGSLEFDCQLLDCGRNCIVNIAAAEHAVVTKKFTAAEVGDSLDVRPTTEAIMILFDASGSMGSVWAEGDYIATTETGFRIDEEVEISGRGSSVWQFGRVMEQAGPSEWLVRLEGGGSCRVSSRYIRKMQNMSRISAAKRLLDAFSDRSMAYDVPHEIGLVVFSSTVNTRVPLTKLFKEFEAAVDTISANGSTRLFDALKHAADALVEFQKEHPTASLRIVCLTDGEDTGSSEQPHHVAQFLQSSGIVVDSLLIGGTENRPLVAISKATGGMSIKPASITEALETLEDESTISLSERGPRPPIIAVTGLSGLLSLASQVSSQNIRPAPVRAAAVTTTAITASAMLASLASTATITPSTPATATTTTSTGGSSAAQKCVIRQLSAYHSNPHANATVYPDADNIFSWRLLLKGPIGTPFEGGVFRLAMTFGQDFPFKAPTVRFETAIYHCNVSSAGRLCLDVLSSGWSPNLTVRRIIDDIVELLITPDTTHPLDSSKAEEYYADRATYTRRAKEHTAIHASKTIEEHLKEFGLADSS